MKLSSIILIIATATAELVRVNDKNFKEVVRDSGKFTLVDFYADWCRHCMNLMPTIEQLGDLYSDVPDVQIVKINGDEDGRKMSTKYDIPGFPHLLLFHGEDQPIEFQGRRDLESISNFIQQASGLRLGQKEEEHAEPIPETSRVMNLNDENFKELVLDAPYKTIVIFSAPWCRFCKDVKPIWLKIANEIYASDGDVIRFGEVDLSDENESKCQKIKAQFGVKTLPTIMLFDPERLDADGLKRPVVYNDDRNLEYIITFINDETGLSRNYEGKLFNNAGRIMSIDEAIRTFEEKKGEEILNQIEELEKQFLEHGRDLLVQKDVLFFKDDCSMLPYYRKVVKKLISGDKEYFVKEISRLKRILSKEEENLEKTALDYMQKRLNVLEGVSNLRGFKIN